MMLTVIKRDGRPADFDANKIYNSVEAAAKSAGEVIPQQIIKMIVATTVANFQGDIVEGSIEVDDILNAVQQTLMQFSFRNTAKEFILYRERHKKVRTGESTQWVQRYLDSFSIDTEKAVELSAEEDWQQNANASTPISVGGFIMDIAGEATKNYWLFEIYDPDVQKAHNQRMIHIHDLSMLTGYCAGWSLKQLIQLGICGVVGRTSAKPAQHLSVLCNQMVNFLGIMQNEWAGAQAFSSFDTYLAPFVKADNLTYREVKKCIESFVYGVNMPSRWGTQAPFSNITLDWVCPPDMKDQPAIVGGEEQDFTYGDCKPEMDMINKAFLEVMIEGDANGRGFQYPIPTYSITRDFDWSDTENNRLLFEMTAKYGTPYFSNYINSDMEPSDVRSMCCRLRLDLRELRKKSGGYFGSGESTGSVGVVTINMPQIAFLAENKADFYKRLDYLMDVAARSLKTKRRVITDLLEKGLYPYTKAYLGSFDNHFSTIGLVGMNEAGLNAKWLKADMTDPRTQEWTKEVLNHMRERLVKYQDEYGDLYNLEATPAESTAYRFASYDKVNFPGIITAGGEEPYYTNSSHLPVNFTNDVFDALDIQDGLQTLYTSGTVFHAFLGERIPDWKSAAALVRKIAENYRLPYYTMSPIYSVCGEHGYLAGEQKKCPICGKTTEIYSRITGYYRPVQNWNAGKFAEYKDRLSYEFGVGSPSAKQTAPAAPVVEKTEEVTPAAEAREEIPNNDNIVIVGTKVCPNCKILKSKLSNLGLSYEEVYIEDDPDIADRMGIQAAPTAIYKGQLYPGMSILKEVS